jgi:hypothetical protein
MLKKILKNLGKERNHQMGMKHNAWNAIEKGRLFTEPKEDRIILFNFNKWKISGR